MAAPSAAAPRVGSSHLLALERVLTALSNVGLEREARLLAIEAALARGV